MAVEHQRRPTGMRLAHQFWLSLVLPIAIAIALYGAFASADRKQVLRREASAEIGNYAALVQASMEGALASNDLELVRRRAEQFARAERIVGVAAFTPEGEEVVVTQGLEKARAGLDALARQAYLQGHDIEEQAILMDQEVLLRTVFIGSRGKGPALIAILVRDRHYVQLLEQSLNRGLAVTGALLLAASALVAGVVGRYTVGLPATAILTGAERVTSGDLNAAVPEKGAEELSRLAFTFNKMTQSLREARARAEREEAARVNIERKLQQAQALAAAGQVASSLGHEIGSPLNVILGRARRAADLPGCPAPLRAELEIIARQSERITRVVSRLLSLARPPRSAQSNECDLVRVVEDVFAFLGPECRKRGVEMTISYPRDAPRSVRVALDSDQLFQVVFNLCMNAIEAQEGGGSLTVRIASAHDGLAGTDAVSFEVEDRGPGIRTEDVSRIFEPFFTTRTKKGGSGLGLTIVSGIVQEAGGTVEVASSQTGGALFRVTLPSTAPSLTASAEPGAPQGTDLV